MRAWLLVLGWLAGCGRPAPEPSEVVFVRGGIIASEGQGRALPGGRVLQAREWSPGEVIVVGGEEVVAPERAECRALFGFPLGDVSTLIAMGGEGPDTALAFSPDGDRLAVGTYHGEVLVLDAWSGDVIARRRLAETMVKRLAWSADGSTLYAGEQSPDALLHALDTGLASRWALRLADRVQSSTAPAGEDLYGVYSLPGVFGLDVLPGGDLLVVAAHGWNVSEGERRNQSVVLRIRPSGEVAAAWPEAPADATFRHLVVGGGFAAVPVSRSATGAPPPGLPIGGVQVLSLSLAPVGAFVPPPLPPWYAQAAFWHALDLSHDRVLLGLADGRIRLTDHGGELHAELTTGAPVLAGEVPVAAGIGWGAFLGHDAAFVTASTTIPWGAAAPDLRPPMAHPNENTLWVVGPDGTTRWTWSGSQSLEGLVVAPDGRHLVVGAGSRHADARRDLYGALVFDAGGPDRPGEARLVAVCPTEGPVFYGLAVAADGRVAVAEYPVLEPDGKVSGAYRVTVLR